MPNIVGERTFFIRTGASAPQQIQPCQACKEQQRFWQCKVFTQKDVSERWNIAKRFQLCYRCLAEGHHGKSCPRTRRCGKNDIKKPVGRQILNQNQIPDHAAPTYNMDTRDQKLSPQLTSLSARRGRVTQNNVHTLPTHT